MKKSFTILFALLLTTTIWAKAPQKMSYQAVIRNSSDALVVNTQVGMQITILQGSVNGDAVYTETQTPTTNANGLVSIEIGDGVGFDVIDWVSGSYFIKTETDPTGGTSYTITGTSQLLSVPYALHAKTSDALTSAHYVGELYGGGVVFWVDHTGQHGLILNMVDLSTSQEWSNVDDVIIGSTNDWDGANNTIAIIGQNGHTSSAAKLCDDYTNTDYGTGTYSDWYLPSLAELNCVLTSFYEVQKVLANNGNADSTPLATDYYYYYWTSTESYTWEASNFGFDKGGWSTGAKHHGFYVRAVRAF